MGWGRTFLLGDIGNRLDIADCEEELTALRQSLNDTIQFDLTQEEQIQKLQDENGELKLLVAALSRLLVTKGVITQDELRRFVRIIDGEDGAVDGKSTGKPI